MTQSYQNHTEGVLIPTIHLKPAIGVHAVDKVRGHQNTLSFVPMVRRFKVHVISPGPIQAFEKSPLIFFLQISSEVEFIPSILITLKRNARNNPDVKFFYKTQLPGCFLTSTNCVVRWRTRQGGQCVALSTD